MAEQEQVQGSLERQAYRLVNESSLGGKGDLECCFFSIPLLVWAGASGDRVPETACVRRLWHFCQRSILRTYHVVSDNLGVVLCGGARGQTHVAHVRVAKVVDGRNSIRRAPAVRWVEIAEVGHNRDEPDLPGRDVQDI